jgi:hypothetical protein
MRTRLSVLFVLAGLLMTAGCQRLNYDKSFSLQPMSTQQIDFDPPSYSQKLSVSITPDKAGVSAYLIKTADKAAVLKVLDAEKEPEASQLLASKVSKGAAETYTLDASVPAKTGYTLILKTVKPTDVKVKVTGR